MATIQEEVAKKISESGNTVKNIVIDVLAQVEITRRIKLITKGIAKQDTLKKEFDKINRDDTTTYVDRKPVSSMSEARFKEIKKAEEVLDKLGKALDKALDENTADSYNKLAELVK